MEIVLTRRWCSRKIVSVKPVSPCLCLSLGNGRLITHLACSTWCRGHILELCIYLYTFAKVRRSRVTVTGRSSFAQDLRRPIYFTYFVFQSPFFFYLSVCLFLLLPFLNYFFCCVSVLFFHSSVFPLSVFFFSFFSLVIFSTFSIFSFFLFSHFFHFPHFIVFFSCFGVSYYFTIC